MKKLNEPITQDKLNLFGQFMSDECYQIWLNAGPEFDLELKELRKLGREIKSYLCRKILLKLLQKLSDKYLVLNLNLLHDYRANTSTLDGDSIYEDIAKLFSIMSGSGIKCYLRSVLFEKCIDHMGDYKSPHKKIKKMKPLFKP